jgi:hypothetical protein
MIATLLVSAKIPKTKNLKGRMIYFASWFRDFSPRPAGCIALSLRQGRIS